MRIGWRGALGMALSVALLYWTLHDVSLARVWQILRGANVYLLLAAVAVATTAFPIRAWRWRYILHPVAPDVSYGALWRSTAIGMMVNNVVPARAGELARAFTLTRETARESSRVSFAAALGSLAVDRIFDGIAILAFLLVVVVAPSFPRGTRIGGRPAEHWLLLGAVVALSALVFIAVIAFFPQTMLRLWDAAAGRLLPRFAERGRGLLLSFASGLGVLRDPGRFAIVLAWSLVQWGVNGVSFWLAFRAFGITAPFSAAIFIQSLLALGVAIPSSPGFFGVFEAISKAGLTVYGVDETVAVSFAIGYHLLSFIPITVIGLWYFAGLGLHFRDLSAPAVEH